jgi:hypothetical protein
MNVNVNKPKVPFSPVPMKLWLFMVLLEGKNSQKFPEIPGNFPPWVLGGDRHNQRAAVNKNGKRG